MSAELILVAEDNREIAQIVEEKILRPAGYQVRCVGDGMSALTLAQDLKPDLVITDQQMPGLAGLDLIRRLRTALPGTPTILMSSEGSDKLILAALRAGACDFLVKPFASDELLQAVRRALENRSEGRDKDEGSLARRVQELETLAMIGRTVTAVLDLDVVLTTVVEAAVRLTGAEEGSLLLVDGATGELYMRASKNFDEDFAHTFRLQVQDSLAGQVLEKGEPILLDESSPQKIKTAYLVHSLIYVPLQVRGKTIGVLGVDNRKAGKQLTREDVTLLMAMAA
ncbi:MAG TPA: response regulator [Chloroflexi bacterium]|nr:response regulator [Chloroflexota bacterium]